MTLSETRENAFFLLFICIYTTYICKKLNNKPWGDWVWDKGEVYRKNNSKKEKNNAIIVTWL